MGRADFGTGKALFDKPAIAHRQVAGGEAGQILAVGDDDEGGQALSGDLQEGFRDMGGAGAVEVASGFVGEEDTRFSREGPGKGGPLHFPAAELVGVVVAASRETGEVEGFLHPGPGHPGGVAAQEEGEFHVFRHGHGGQKVEKLKHDAEVVAAVAGEFGIHRIVKGEVADPDAAGVRLIQAAEEIEQGALAAAARAGDGDKFPIGDLEVDFPQGGDGVATAAVNSCDLLEADH